MNLLFEGNVKMIHPMSCGAKWRKSDHGKRKVSMTTNILSTDAAHYLKISTR